jgi:5-formyltetrahydrofolate cyclo-ligase
MTTSPDRDELRRCGRTARRGLGTSERTTAETTINSALVELVLATVGPHARVGGSWPTDGEVDVRPALEELGRRGVRTYLPVVGSDRSMRFAPWSVDGDVQVNRYGIPEPLAADPADTADTAGADALDVIVVPCVAVDREGGRLGFGAGYYDRALAAGRPALVVGVAFEGQVVGDVGTLPHDERLDAVITEAGTTRVGG